MMSLAGRCHEAYYDGLMASGDDENLRQLIDLWLRA